jgi:hypothetical protein
MVLKKNDKKKKVGCSIGCLSVILILLSVSVIFFQYRHFYKVGCVDFTFWKTGNGCYITPYKYYGVTIPKDNYMKAGNLGGTIIFVGEDTTLYIFPIHPYYRGADTIECNLPLYKYKYFPYINEVEHAQFNQNMIDYYENLGYPYINIYIAEMSAKIGNSPANNVTKIKKER